MGSNGNRRLDYIDIAKCIGMFMIIWGHILLRGKSNLFVYSFHIPLFFFLSGMVFNAGKYPTIGSLIRRRARTLLLPYLMFSLLTWLIWVGTKLISHEEVNLFKPLLETFMAQGSVGYMVHNLPLWFVPCLFVVEVLFYFINKLPELANLLCCLVCAVIGTYMIRGGHLDFFSQLPWSIEGAMSALLFYAAGNLLIRHCPHEALNGVVSPRKWICTLVALGLFVGLWYTSGINGTVSLGSNELGNNSLLFYGNGFVGIVATIVICIVISDIKARSFIGKQIMDYVKWFGKNSFYVMATHFPIKEAIIRVIGGLFHCGRSGVVSDVRLSLIAFVITLLVDSLVVYWVVWLKRHFERKRAVQ